MDFNVEPYKNDDARIKKVVNEIGIANQKLRGLINSETIVDVFRNL
jgi:hypothetical protein